MALAATLGYERGVYRAAFWFLKKLPAETAHHSVFLGLRAFAAVPLATSLLRAWSTPKRPRLAIRCLGIDFPSPLGLAAGFDKDAKGPDALGALGFGYVEVGTVTAEPQPGNPRPRMFRLPSDRALLNRMGFNNDGAARAAERLAHRRGARTVVGVNIGKTKVCPAKDAPSDYAKSAELLARFAAYCVVNVSSPNTPGLRDLQSTAELRPILVATREALDRGEPSRRVPLLVKIAPDLADEDVDAVADLALELGLDGIVAANTTISRAGLATPAEEVAALGAGGISGAPLRARASALVGRVFDRVGRRMIVVSVGGIETAEDAWERITQGASLLQMYTGFIYAGPSAPRRILEGLDARLAAGGFARLADAVGSARRR